MLGSLVRPFRSIFSVVEQQLPSLLAGTEHEILGSVHAIERATDSIEHHVEVIEGLATSIPPLTESVNHLTATLAELVELLGPLVGAEREVARVEHFFGRRRRGESPQPDA